MSFPMQFEEFDAVTQKLSKETQRVILPYFEDPDLEVLSKSDDTPVTAADRETERMIRGALEALYPDHGVEGEEFDEKPGSSAYSWVIDPIDGTKTFAAGCPLFGTMIALLHEGQPLYGCINYPALGKRLVGDGIRAFCNGDPVAARRGIPLEKSILLTTDVASVAAHRDGAAFEALVARVRFCRTWGDCYGYYLVATGKAEAMVDPIMNPWDIMALVPILRGAGATITDWLGGDPAKGDSCIAANADLHETILRILNP